MFSIAEGSAVVRFGDFALDLRTGELFSPGTHTVLPQQLFRLLATLLARRGALVTRDQLRHELWPDDTFVDFEPSLNAAIRRLRDVLGDSAETPRFIETLPRRGYRFIAPVNDGPDVMPVAPLVAAAEPSFAAPRLRRLPRWIALGAAIVAAVLGGVAWVMTRSVDRVFERALDLRLLAGRLTNVGTVRLASLSPDGLRLAYVRADGAQESVWLRNGDGTSHIQLLPPVHGNYRSVTFGPRDFVYYTLFLPDRTHISLYRVYSGGGTPELVGLATGRVSFSPDRLRYASVYSASLAHPESRVVIDDVSGGASRVVATRQAPSSFLTVKPAWSADGRALAVPAVNGNGKLELVVVDHESGQERQRLPLPLTQVTDVAWLSDGTIAVAARERTGLPQRLWRLMLPSMALQPLTHDSSDYALAGVLPGGLALAAVRGESAQGLWIADVSSRDRPRQVAADSGSLSTLEGIAWTPGGRIVYAAMDSGNVDVYAVDPQTGERRRLTSDPAADFHPDVSADGTMVVFASERGGAPGVWVMSIDGRQPRRLTTGADTRPSFSPDGRWVVIQRVSSDNVPATLWRVSVETGHAVRVGPPESLRPAVSPDGRMVAHYWMTPEQWKLAITAIDSELPARTFPISRTHSERVIRWAPDGSGLAFVDAVGGVPNVWFQPLDGGPLRALTNLADGGVPAFDWSPDGTKLAWTRVTEVRDVVTIPLAPGT
jgi:Tol biopolymer transport system component/DNA-binding winged helix-turn-helix (wHTH) protein